MLLLRIQLPDRPGLLGQVATLMGTVGADIGSIEIIEKRPNGSVIDDFVLSLPPGVLAESVVTACAGIEGVEVLWLSRYPDSWSTETDVEVYDAIARDPSAALAILTERAPQVFHCQWALLTDVSSGTALYATDQAPELSIEQLEALRPFDEVHTLELDKDWLPGWGSVVVALTPVIADQVLIVGRKGGPEFLNTELLRLRHLAGISST